MDILVTNPELGCKILLRMAEEMAGNLQNDYANLCQMGWSSVAEEDGVGMDPTAQ